MIAVLIQKGKMSQDLGRVNNETYMYEKRRRLMSCGKVVCSVCRKEVGQMGDKNIKKGWEHYDKAQTPICDNAQSVYPPIERD